MGNKKIGGSPDLHVSSDPLRYEWGVEERSTQGGWCTNIILADPTANYCSGDAIALTKHLVAPSTN
jgi:hypothetical protein